MGRGHATMTVRLRSEKGFALPVAMIILMVVALLAGAAVLAASHSTDRASRDEASAQAFAAADAAVDIATWRINKLVAPEILTGPVLSGDARARGCVNLGVEAGRLQFSLVGGSATDWCPVASGVINDGPGDPARYEYWMEAVVAPGSGVLRRRVIALGRVGDVVRRIQVVLELELGTTDPLALFKRRSYLECTAAEPPSGNPASGCST